MNKYNYVYVLQGYYNSWEDLSAAPKTLEGWKEIRGLRKDYRYNEGGSYRIVSRREPNVHT